MNTLLGICYTIHKNMLKNSLIIYYNKIKGYDAICRFIYLLLIQHTAESIYDKPIKYIVLFILLIEIL